METIGRCALRLLPSGELGWSREVDAQLVLCRMENRAGSRAQPAEQGCPRATRALRRLRLTGLHEPLRTFGEEPRAMFTGFSETNVSA
jgi:hypothetical protein